MGSGASSENHTASNNPPKRKWTSKPHGGTPNAAGEENERKPNRALDPFQPKTDLVLLPGDADDASLRFLDVVASADDLPANDVAGKLRFLRQAEDLLPTLPAENVDHLTVLLFHREGDAYHRSHSLAKAKDAYRKGIQIAELKVAEKGPLLSLMLQRYTSCILAISSIWFLEEQGKKKKHHRSFGVDEQRASETAILRCIELLELGLHQHSEHLLWPLFRLVDMYEELQLYGRALRYLRRAIGIVCQCFSYDHDQIPQLLARQEELSRKRDEQLLYDSAVKLQSIVRMRLCMQMLSVTLQRRVSRHFWLPKKCRPLASDPTFLNQFCSHEQHEYERNSGVVESSSTSGITGISPAGRRSRNALLHEAARPLHNVGIEDQPAYKKLLDIQGTMDAAGTTKLLFTDANREQGRAVEAELKRRSRLRGWVAEVDDD